LNEGLPAAIEALPIITDYDGLRAALAARRRELKLSQLDLDALTLLPDGYCSKLEAQKMKNYGPLSLACTLGALGVAITLVPANRAQLKNASTSWVESEKHQQRLRMKRAAKANRAWLAQTTREERRAWARKAARVRWRNWREAKAEKAKRERQAKRKSDSAEG
jgi:hypothetical protein